MATQSYSPYNVYTLYNVNVFIPFLLDPLFISFYYLFLSAGAYSLNYQMYHGYILVYSAIRKASLGTLR